MDKVLSAHFFLMCENDWVIFYDIRVAFIFSLFLRIRDSRNEII